MLICFAALFATVLIANLFSGNFAPGFANQPYAHTNQPWNFLGMYLVGFASLLIGGCPFRQLVLAGCGNADSALTVAGIMAGAALSHNLGLASSADGPTQSGKIAFALCVALTFIIAFANTKKISVGESAGAA